MARFQKGNKIGNRFTSEKQPENSGRPEGARNRSTIAKKWLNTVTKWKNPLTGLEESLTLEDQITLAQIKKARDDEGNTSASYRALMDTTYGNTRQEIDLYGEIKITDHKISVEIVPPPEEEAD